VTLHAAVKCPPIMEIGNMSHVGRYVARFCNTSTGAGGVVDETYFLHVIGHSSLVIGDQAWKLDTVPRRTGFVSHGSVRYGAEKRVKTFRANRLRGERRACIRVRYESVRHGTPIPRTRMVNKFGKCAFESWWG